MATATTAIAAPAMGGLKVNQARVAHSEWIKLRSLRSTIWTLGVSAAMTVGTGLLLCTAALGHLNSSGHSSHKSIRSASACLAFTSHSSRSACSASCSPPESTRPA